MTAPQPATARPGWWARYSLAITIATGAIAVAEQLHLWWTFGRRFVSQDHALLWYAAREWGELHLHEPSFYGQNYGSTLEAIPAELARMTVGVSARTSLPLLLAAAAVVPWFLLAWAARARGHRLVGLLAVAMPILLTTDYTAFQSFYAATVGRTCGVVGAALLLARGERRGWLFAGAMLGAFGIVLEYGVAIVVVPIVVYVLLTSDERARGLRTVAVAAVPAAVWLVGNWWFYREHPEHNFYRLGTTPDLDVLGTALENIDRWWPLFQPELWRWWVLPFAGALVLVGVLVWTRKVRFVVPALLVVVLWMLALASQRARQADVAETFAGLLRRERLVLALPVALWFLVLLLAESGALRWLGRRSQLVAGALVAVVVVSSVVRLVSFQDHTDDLVDRAYTAGALQVVEQDQVFRQCDEHQGIARREQVSLVVYLRLETQTYACGALEHGAIETLTPPDRRTWVVQDESERSRDGFLLINPPRRFCSQRAVRAATTSCRVRRSRTPGDPAIAVVRFEPTTAVRELARLGYAVRPATPGCHIGFTFTWVCEDA